MIDFSCGKCGQKLNVEDKHSGKRVKCPKCGDVCVVPDNSDKMKFNCENCGQSICVPQVHAGKKGKCPKCASPVVVPSPNKRPADGPYTSVQPPIDRDPYQDETEEYEDSDGAVTRTIVVISAVVVATVVLVGLILLTIALDYEAVAVSIVGAICCLGFYLSIKKMSCPACGQILGMKQTGRQKNLEKLIPLYEYKCTRCGHKKWMGPSIG